MAVLHHERDNFVNTNVIKKTCLITSVITIAERLKQAREIAGLNQDELAKRAGVSQGTIANIENGTRKQPRKLLSIARALNVDPEWLESGKEQTAGDERRQPSPAAEQATNGWGVHTNKVKQALSVLEAALTKLDMQGRERLAPLFESFARSPGPIIKDDIAMLLASAAKKSEALEEASLQKTG